MKKHKKKFQFSQTLKEKKEKEDAAYLALIQARTDAIKHTLDGQRRKDLYAKIMREFGDPEKRDSIPEDIHKERIQFLEDVLQENREWRKRPTEPLQLKLDLVELQDKINEIREYVAVRVRTAGKQKMQVSRAPTQPKLSKLTPVQVNEVYEMAKSKIIIAHGGTIKRLSKNVHEGLAVELARERLMAQGAAKQVTHAFNEYLANKGLVLSESEKKAVKMLLLSTEYLDSFIEQIIEHLE